MKDIFAALSSEIFQPLATLVLPGMLAIGAGLIAIAWIFDPVAEFILANHGASALAAILLATFAGLILEDLGARLENLLFRRKFAEDLEDRYKDWYDYLRVAYEIEPVGYKYLATIVLRLKFELGCAAAVPFCILGIWFWPVAYAPRSIATLIVGVAGAYLLIEAWASVGLLASLRRELLKAVTEPAATCLHDEVSV